MKFDPVFDNLLVSSPNGGGLLVLRAGNLLHVDRVSTTGIDVHGATLLRGVQPDRLGVYGEEAFAVAGVALGLADVHDLLLTDGGFLAVGTTDNVVLEFDAALRVRERWHLASAADSIHVNCLALWNDQQVFSAFGDFAAHRGYKDGTIGRGFVRDLPTQRTLIAGLSQPHSLTPMEGNLLLADSESGEIVLFDPGGMRLRSRNLGGYTRGIAVSDAAIFVGLSCSRNADHAGLDTARIVALARDTWQTIATADLPVREIYDIRHCPQRADLDAILDRIEKAGIDWPDWQG